jgi:hypothetical protein
MGKKAGSPKQNRIMPVFEIVDLQTSALPYFLHFRKLLRRRQGLTDQKFGRKNYTIQRSLIPDFGRYTVGKLNHGFCHLHQPTQAINSKSGLASTVHTRISI